MSASSSTSHASTPQRSALKTSAFRLFAHTAMVVGAIFVVTVLLAAMPGHNAPVQAGGPRPLQGSPQQGSA